MSDALVVLRSPLLSDALGRCLNTALTWLGMHAGALNLSGDVLVGPPDAGTWRAVRQDVPLVVVGALGPGRPPPLSAAAAHRADCLVALCDDEAAMLAAAARPGIRVIVAPPDPPAAGPKPARGVVMAPGDVELPALRLLAAAGCARLADTHRAAPGVRLVAGRGSHALAAALCAFADGAVAVAAPGTHGRREITAAGGLVARTPLEAVEAAALACTAPALHDALVARGTRPRPGPVPAVAAAILEALLLVAPIRKATAGTVPSR